LCLNINLNFFFIPSLEAFGLDRQFITSLAQLDDGFATCIRYCFKTLSICLCGGFDVCTWHISTGLICNNYSKRAQSRRLGEHSTSTE